MASPLSTNDIVRASIRFISLVSISLDLAPLERSKTTRLTSGHVTNNRQSATPILTLSRALFRVLHWFYCHIPFLIELTGRPSICHTKVNMFKMQEKASAGLFTESDAISHDRIISET